MNKIGYAVHLIANAVHLSEAPDVYDVLCSILANAVHPSEAPDAHDGIRSTPVGKYSTPSEAPDLHDRICSTLDGKCSTVPELPTQKEPTSVLDEQYFSNITLKI